MTGRFRIASDPSVNDTTGYNSTRTVSSSSSMSTPNDTFGNRGRNRRPITHTPKKVSTKTSKSGRLIKSKLLNLQNSSKRSVTLEEGHPNKTIPGFIIHRSVTEDTYDYGPFINYPIEIDLENTNTFPPAVKESQIKAWESAEKITQSVVFGDDEDDEDDTNDGTIINSIPGYTKAELGVILKLYEEIQAHDGPIQHSRIASWENEENKALFEMKKRSSMHSERMFQKSSSFVQRRQVQINQKKELLGRIFGYQNNLNQEYITNNSSYSTLDNSPNLQKTFHEDKEEIENIMEEDSAYRLALAETLEKRNDDDKLKDEKMDYSSFQQMVSKNLDRLYRNEDKYDDKLSGELHGMSLSYFRKSLKEDI